eukprot:CAMPEP_0203953010 /NCGR_PEP_ID=MMETSP0359-20131031/86490_1 /ASSEMBLY_ACC=CAM_ASM_000338 /TAXON_ID=268821 /ORGANISM="Scrippsiella Hangoei, Strain SHTV-5" /LENGTH=38 /DNA_ID= /DNA_START= /DNA_END= /DNA_ORIENTATION=
MSLGPPFQPSVSSGPRLVGLRLVRIDAQRGPAIVDGRP